MRPQKHILAIATALLFGASGMLAQSTGSTSGGTTTGTTTTGTTTTSTGDTSGSSTSGTTTTVTSSTGDTSGGTTTGGTTTGGTTTGGTTTGGTTTGGTTTGGTTTGGTTTGGTTTGGTTTGGTTTGSDSMGNHGKSGESHGKAAPHTPNPNSSANAQAVQTILQKFDANRDQYMADRKALLDKLATATTDADRQAILDELKADKAANKEQRTQLGKEIRDELKTLRQQRKSGGG